MAVSITFCGDGAWGTGKGSALIVSEVDVNFYNLQQAVETLQAVGLAPESIGTIVQTGDSITITGSNSTDFGTFALPSRRLNPTGAWLTSTAYAVDDVVAQAGMTYACNTDHTSGTFSTDLAAGKWVLLVDPTAMSLSDIADVDIMTVATGQMLRWNGTDWANVSSLDLPSGGLYKVNGTQVVGAQAAAVADATEDLASVKTQLNDLLAKLRTHGLIASS